MRRIVFLSLALLFAGVSPAFAEGFSQVQFAALIVINLVLGAILTLGIGVLISVLFRKKTQPKKVERRMVERESQA